MSKTLMVMFMYFTYRSNAIANVLLRYELQRRLAGTKYSNISVLAVDPGAMGGNGLFKESPAPLRFVIKYVIASLSVAIRAFKKTDTDLVQHQDATDPSTTAHDCSSSMANGDSTDHSAKGRKAMSDESRKEIEDLDQDEQSQKPFKVIPF